LARLSYGELTRLLKEHGCKYLRDAKGGGHEYWACGSGQPFSVPKKLKGDGTLMEILKAAKIKPPWYR